MHTNKKKVLDRYEAIAKTRIPGRGGVARAIIEGSWDNQATEFVDQERLDSMGYKLDDNLALLCARGIVQRHPEINAKLQSLKD